MMENWHVALDVFLALSNLVTLLFAKSTKAAIAELKVYMHVNFVTRKDLLSAMTPPDMRFFRQSAYDRND